MPAGLGGAVIKSHGSYYQPNAVEFDGSTYGRLSSPGLTSSKQFTFVCTARWDFLDSSQELFSVHTDSNARLLLVKAGSGLSNAFRLFGRNSLNSTILNAVSTISLSANTWYNILVSVDMANTAHLYLNDVDRFPGSPTFVNDTIELATNYAAFGEVAGLGIETMDGDICDLWFDSDRYVDFSTEANRRLFFDAQGRVVYKGTDGSLPFSATPDVFLSGATASWHTNKGSIGGFTLTGSLGTTSDPPPGAKL